MTRNKDDFIMLPTVDFCFKELMQNPKVRKGFIAALLNVSPEEIREPYSKLQKCIHVSILNFIHFENDVECYRKIHFRDNKTGQVYTDLFEIQILELGKLPPEVKSGEDVIAWMRFFSGKTRKEFEHMAKTNEYLDEAYSTLMEISADEQKRLEYEAREKALKDYNTLMESAEHRGLRRGLEQGLERINSLNRLLIEHNRMDDMVKAAVDTKYQEELLKEFHL